MKLRFGVGDLDVPKGKMRLTSSRVEEGKSAQRCPCGNADENRTHMAGGSELYKEKRDVLSGDEEN